MFSYLVNGEPSIFFADFSATQNIGIGGAKELVVLL